MNPELTSIGGIVALTLVLVEILKRGLGAAQRRSDWAGWTWAGDVPTWLWACGVAAALTAASRGLLGLIDGGFWALVVKAIGAAATAGGLYEWLRDPAKAIGQSRASLEAMLGRPLHDDDKSHLLNGHAWLMGLATAGLAAALALGAAGCVDAAYVAADRATFEAVGPEYADYVARDAALNDEQRQRRERTIASWRLRLERAESQTDLAQRR